MYLFTFTDHELNIISVYNTHKNHATLTRHCIGLVKDRERRIKRESRWNTGPKIRRGGLDTGGSETSDTFWVGLSVIPVRCNSAWVLRSCRIAGSGSAQADPALANP